MKASLLLCSLMIASPLLAADEKPGTASPQTAPATAASVKDVTPDQAEQLLKSQKDIIVLDVRTPEEFETGHVAGAKNVDFQDDKFAETLKTMDKSKPVVLHCAAGGRSTRALEKLKELNFQSVYHMNGGFRAWKEAGKPVVK